MIRSPIQPIIFNGVVGLLMRDFSCTLEQAIPLADKLIQSLRSKDLDITRGNWMEQPPITERNQRGEVQSWEKLANDAEEWINSGVSPWKRAELGDRK